MEISLTKMAKRYIATAEKTSMNIIGIFKNKEKRDTTATKKTHKSTIGIFKGKEKIHNEQVLTLLYENEPLSTNELAHELSNVGKRKSLNSTLSKSIPKLETKGYVHKKDDAKWYLKLKGFIAVILIQQEPKKWNDKWTTIFMNTLKTNENDIITGFTNLGISNSKRQEILKALMNSTSTLKTGLNSQKP